jgi:hypothetical protein
MDSDQAQTERIPKVLQDYQVRLLLQDIESADVPRQIINFLSICNQQSRIYGNPGSSVSKLIKQNETII